MDHETLRLTGTEKEDRPDCIVVENGNGSGDLFTVAPGAGTSPKSALEWPRRAARVVAAWNALAGVDESDMAQLVRDGLKYRALPVDEKQLFD